jgi:hypothetical protein
MQPSVKTHVPVYVFVRETRRRVMSIFRNLVIARSRPLCSLRSLVPPTSRSYLCHRSAPRAQASERQSQTRMAKSPLDRRRRPSKQRSTRLAEDTGLAPNGQPTNKVLPVKISFPPRSERATRIASWNICSLASSQKKVGLTRSSWSCGTPTIAIQGFKYYVEAEDPDILILTETKVGTY